MTQLTKENPELHLHPFPRQSNCWRYLLDKETTEIGYGGAGHGGKTWLGSEWVLTSCLSYPGIGILIGRNELKNLRMTTQRTFFKVCNYYGIRQYEHFHYDGGLNVMRFYNGSEVFWSELKYKPSDPLNTWLGSFELTYAWVDESIEVYYSVLDTLRTRLGRRLNTEYNLAPKMLETFNPDKGHVYSRFYKPFKENKLPEYRKFIRALPKDNPYTTEAYKRQIFNSSQVTIQRLWYGNFEYDDDPSCLIEFDAIADLFTNKVAKEGDLHYISADIARFGNDRTVVKLWKGLQVIKVYMLERQDTVKTADFIKHLAETNEVRRSHIVIDEAGVGGGVVDQIEGCYGFIGASAPLGETNYKNLRTQCYFVLAKMINDGKIGIDTVPEEIRLMIIQDLEQVKQKDIDKDGKLMVIPKEQVKEMIQRSPDFGDTLSMRMVFECQPEKEFTFIRL